MKMQNGPLTGVKVLDLSLLLPGPLCSQHLADMGAEVIKVENPRMGDLTRYMSTKVTKGDFAESGIFLQLNRNKSSITVNIKREGGREVIMRLLEDCDILLEGFRPDTLNELGIGYEQLKEKFPRLIYCAISGYGATGRYKEHAGHDANYIARAGPLGAERRERRAARCARFSGRGYSRWNLNSGCGHSRRSLCKGKDR
jgi:alpha-methylacyl-CoA racemase